MNRVEVSGRLTRDPSLQYVGDRRFPICNLNVAVDDGTGRFNRETRKTEYESGFYQVEVTGDYGVAVANGLSKGDEVYVVGSLSQWRMQPKEGQEHGETKTRIRAAMVMPLTAKIFGPPDQIDPPQGFDPSWGNEF